jgi:hypothetical protein
MNRIISFITGTALLAATIAAGAAEPGRRTYRWVDSQGVVHFGDHVPAEYANASRQVLNQQGVAINAEAGVRAPEQLAAEKAAAERAAAEQQAQAESARRDQILLSTYMSVAEIEALRDQRVEQMTAQIKVTEHYLEGLRQNLKKLQAEAAAFKPYSTDPNARPIDEKLANELTSTMDSILLYEKNLADTRLKQSTLVAQFTADINRFAELTGR